MADLFTANIGFSHIVVLSALCCILFFRYLRQGPEILKESSFYFVIFCCGYISAPIVAHHYGTPILVSPSEEARIHVSQYGLYIQLMMLLYQASKLASCGHQTTTYAPIKLPAISNRTIVVASVLVVSYASSVFLFNAQGFEIYWRDRGLASEFVASLNRAYKLNLAFYSIAGLIIYLSLKTDSRRSIFLLTPFVFMDLLTTDRNFIFQVFALWLAVSAYLNRSIPILRIILVSISIISVEVIRVAWRHGFSLSQFVIVPGELLFTAESPYVILFSKEYIPFFDAVVYSFGKVLTPQLMTFIFDGTPHFRYIIDRNSPLSFGLGGSLISEPFSYGSQVVSILYPFFIILYLEGLNRIRRNGGFFGLMIFAFFLTNLVNTFRGGLIFNSMDPLYYALYPNIWYWAARAWTSKRVIVATSKRT
ncbi:hypothetical protein ACGYKB_17480 [Sulfitobacter sp. 916]|uniref:hypothetical protein n=1 Tax=Sulfitobacter sp. 916 TaxID=3368559 RepID=UPI0037466169